MKYSVAFLYLQHHTLEGYGLMENFFLMPAASIIGQLVEDADIKNVSIRCFYLFLLNINKKPKRLENSQILRKT